MRIKNNSGFTILELMIVVAIILVLTTIGYPAYQKYGMRTKRSEAKTALMALQQAQEKYRANCPSYATGIGARSCAAGAYTVDANNASEHGYYNLAIANANATTYTLTATAAGEQANDADCARFSIDQNGTKTAEKNTGTTGSPVYAAATEDCWK